MAASRTSANRLPKGAWLGTGRSQIGDQHLVGAVAAPRTTRRIGRGQEHGANRPDNRRPQGFP